MPVEQDSPQRPPGRGNGLPADAYVAIADLEPRVADDVLISLHANAIAAYLEPTPTAAPPRDFSVVEVFTPTFAPTSTDRLFVDARAVDQARHVVEAELADSSYSAELGSLLPDDTLVELRTPADPANDDHYSPPPPPPLPRLRPSTVGSLAAIVVGLVILISGYDGGEFGLLGMIAIFGGIVSLVWHMKDGPPTDSGWDDGAVL